mgnify:CR=1 FL=1
MEITINEEELLKHKVHWGHTRRVFHPKFQPLILGEVNGIYIIDYRKTKYMLEKAIKALVQIIKNKGTILFVGTKEGIAPILEETIGPLQLPYISHKWIPGLLTNFNVIKQSINKMKHLRSMVLSGEIQLYTKKERVKLIRQLVKMEKKYMPIENMPLPHAIFIIDPAYERNALAEALNMNLLTFAIVDSNCDPSNINYPIPANDDTPESVSFILGKIAEYLKQAIIEMAVQEHRPVPEFKKTRFLTIKEYLEKLEKEKKAKLEKKEEEGKKIEKVEVSTEVAQKEGKPTGKRGKPAHHRKRTHPKRSHKKTRKTTGKTQKSPPSSESNKTE